MQFLQSYLHDFAATGAGLLLSFAFFIALERLFPRPGIHVTMAARVKALLFWLVNAAIVVVIAYGMRWVMAPLDIRPIVPALTAGLPGPVGVVVAVIAAAFIGDFFYYWCHRIQHRYFWRFHAVHHSVSEMNGLAGYHHFTEPLFEFVLYIGPLSLLTTSPYAIPVLAGLLGWQGAYEHSPTRLNFGPLGRYFVDNRFHRIHHSSDPRHFDKNFGIFSTLWDSVFGTAHFPAPDEWPATGVAEMPELETLGEFLLAPLRWRPAELDGDLVGDT
jgi:sterol desaturase/sphingolipid hydroxylase (fatty acid hydroxylase superfamily)